jgi:hypothetical protein
MVLRAKDLWDLVLHRQHIDPSELAEAIEAQAAQGPIDYRTRLLIHDGVGALQNHWGPSVTESWLRASPACDVIEPICREVFDRVGFPYLSEQLMEPTTPESILQMLRELSGLVHRPTRMVVGGAGSLILTGHLARRTQDIDVVDEVPADLRSQHVAIERISRRYQLDLAHFQSHYLPSGWENRLHSEGPFDRLQVYLVDVYDIFLSKLFSKREKDRDDLRVLIPQLEKETLVRKLRETTAAWCADAELRANAVKNWYILYGESFPS